MKIKKKLNQKLKMTIIISLIKKITLNGKLTIGLILKKIML